MVGRVLERAVPGRTRRGGRVAGELGADRAREELVPGAVQRTLAIDEQRVARRRGDQVADREVVRELLQVRVESGRHAVRDVQGRVAQRPGSRDRALALGLRQVLRQPLEERAPISRSLARSSAPWPASILTVTAWCQVAIGSLQASTVKLAGPGSSSTTVACHRSVPGVPGSMRTVCCDLLLPVFAAPVRTTTVAATLSWPSRNTTADTGIGSPTTARAGNSALVVDPTTG